MNSVIAIYAPEETQPLLAETTESLTELRLSLASLPWSARAQLENRARLPKPLLLPYRLLSSGKPNCEVKTDCEGSVRVPQEVHTAEPTSSSQVVNPSHSEQVWVIL